MVTKKAINTCENGTARTIVAWYAKGGRSNFAAWNGPGRFLMTAVLEEYDNLFEYMKKTGKIKLSERFSCYFSNIFSTYFNTSRINIIKTH